MFNCQILQGDTVMGCRGSVFSVVWISYSIRPNLQPGFVGLNIMFSNAPTNNMAAKTVARIKP